MSDRKICKDCGEDFTGTQYPYYQHPDGTFECEDCGYKREKAEKKEYKDTIRYIRDKTNTSIKISGIAFAKAGYDKEKAIAQIFDDEKIVCPHCGYDSNDFPDLFFMGCADEKYDKNQVRIQEYMQADGYNVCTCGQCGGVVLTRKNKTGE